MTHRFSPEMFMNRTVQPLALRHALLQIVDAHKVSRNDLAGQLGIGPFLLSQILMGIDWEVLEPWLAIQGRVIEVLRRYGLLEGEAVPEPDFPAEPVSALPTLAQECDAAEGSDPFMGSAEEVTAGETRAK